MWKSDPNLLSKKILERIAKSKDEVSYTDLEKVAKEKDIDLNVFDAALSVLHRHKKVKQRLKGEEIYYKAIPKVKKERKPARQCLVKITNHKSDFYGAMIYPLNEFKRENKVLYRYGAVCTPGYGENRMWFCPFDIGLANSDLPIPDAVAEGDVAFPEIDYSHIFLTPTQMMEYKAQLKGMSVHTMKRLNRYGNNSSK